jgi:hypothetical protein
MGYAWDMRGIRVGYVWDVHGIRMGIVSWRCVVFVFFDSCVFDSCQRFLLFYSGGRQVAKAVIQLRPLIAS